MKTIKAWALITIRGKLIDICLESNRMEATIRWTKIPHRETKYKVVPIEIKLINKELIICLHSNFGFLLD